MYFIYILCLIINILISLVNIWWCRWGYDQELNGVCAQFFKVTLNVDEEEEEGEDEEEEEEVDLESGDQTEFGNSNIN